jgi:hypothetical protein
LTDISHVFPDDVDFLVQGPNMQTLIFLSDAGGTNDWIADDIQITDLAANLASDTGAIPSGEYKPTNYTVAADPFPAPAPAPPHGSPAPSGTDTFESKFGTNAANMNGTWNLYVVDDLAGFTGTIAGGWKLTFESADYACPFAASPRADFDGDGKTDLSVFRPGEGNWYLDRSTAGFAVHNWGASGDILVPGDFDGDGKADTAVFRPSSTAGVPDFLVLNSSGLTSTGFEWGIPGDIPVVGDYDGDGKDDVAVFRPADRNWYIRNSSNGSARIDFFGLPTDIPLAIDHDGDGKDNIGVFRPSDSTWYLARSTGAPETNFIAIPFGSSGDKVVPADYDGDGKEDVAVYRPSNGTWYVLRSSDGSVQFVTFGNSTDVPVPGDYDGDGKYDQAVYRNGQWWINRSTSGVNVAAFGVGSDIAVPAEYIP